MKLLLTSAGFTNPTIVGALQDLCNKPLGDLNLAFIPTAANVETGSKGWLVRDMLACRKLEPALFDIVDISALPKQIWIERLERAHILVFGGGNTYYLAHWMYKSGLAKLLPEWLKTKIYVGISAGSIATAHNLKMSSAKNTYDEEIGVLKDKGLGLVAFHVRPHLNSPKFPKASTEHLIEVAQEIREPIYGIDDNTAIKVDGNQIEVVSEGTWQRFN